MALTYTVIKSRKQYNKYCKEIYDLLSLKKQNKDQKNAIDLLTVLIDKWQDENCKLPIKESDPVEFIVSIMEDHKMKPVDLAKALGVSKSLVSDILNYRRGISKEIVRKLADRFKMQQDAFNRPYELKKPIKRKAKKRSKLPKAA